MIQIIPCISVIGNRIARFDSTNSEKIHFYDLAPLDAALRFEEHGITNVHVLDLEGSRCCKVVNTPVLESISEYTNLTIDFGGGISKDEDIRLAFEYGADMINAASIAVTDRELFSSWLVSFGRKRVILSVDVLDDIVLTKGWANKTKVHLMELLEYFYEQGVYYVKCSDVSKDGTLSGPSFQLYKKILDSFPNLHLIASGGVRSIADIERLQDLGVHAVIFAKAFYEKQISLKDLQKFL